MVVITGGHERISQRVYVMSRVERADVDHIDGGESTLAACLKVHGASMARVRRGVVTSPGSGGEERVNLSRPASGPAINEPARS